MMKRTLFPLLALSAALTANGEPTKRWSQGDPTADEQYALEVINRVRRDPRAAADFYIGMENLYPVLKAAIGTNTFRPSGSPPLTPEDSLRASVELQLAAYNSSVGGSRTAAPKPPLAFYPLFAEQASAQNLATGTAVTFPAFDAAAFFNTAGANLPTTAVIARVQRQFGFNTIAAPQLSGSNATGGTATLRPGFAPGGGPQNFSRGQLLFVANYYDARISMREAFVTGGATLETLLDDSFVTNTDNGGTVTLRGTTRMIGLSLGPVRTATPGQGSRVLSAFATDNEAFQSSDLPFGADTLFITGVVYRDSDHDGDYTPGEGIAGVTITPSAGEWYAITSASGGFAIPVPKNFGNVTVAAKGAGVDRTLAVTVANENVKADVVIVPVILPPTITQQPAQQNVSAGSAVFSVAATPPEAGASISYQWYLDGRELSDSGDTVLGISGAASSTLTVSEVAPWNVGVYSVVATSGGRVSSVPALLSFLPSGKLTGFGSEVGTDIHHPNGNIYDQVLPGQFGMDLRKAAISLRADPGQVKRASYVDVDHDIVQVEFSGAGVLTLVIENASGPSAANYYNQAVNYLHGHAHVVIAGADESTYVTIFTVGKVTAIDQSLFKDTVTYDGVADLSYLAISSANGKFGGVFAGNVHFFATRGITGLYAPNVTFAAPVNIGDISAFDQAQAVFKTGSVPTARITGGTLEQGNGTNVEVSGVTQLQFIAGSTSHGNVLPAQRIKTRLIENGVDVTDRVVVGP